MNAKILRTLFIILLNTFFFEGVAQELHVDSFDERVEDLTANTQPVFDFNNNKCALIKISIPEKATFEGNILKSEYKTNEYYVYVSPGTKRIAIKYPGVETLLLPLADYLDGSGVVSGRTYRLKLSGIPQDIPQLTIIMPDTKSLIDSLLRTGELQMLTGLTLNPVYIWKPNKFIIKAYADVGFGNAINVKSAIPLASHKVSANNFGVDFGFNMWQNEKNSLNINAGVGYNMLNLKLNTSNLSFSYDAPAAADMDGNTYVRYYDLNTMNQEIKTAQITVPVYLGYTYNITHWLGIYVNIGTTLGFKSSSNFHSVTGDGYTYGIYPQYGDLKIEESYINGFGNMNLSSAGKKPVEVSGFTASLLTGIGLEGRISGPLWVFAGVKYNLGFTNIFKSSYNAGENFTDLNAPISYTVSEGEMVNPLTGYLTGSKLSMFSLNVGLSLKF